MTKYQEFECGCKVIPTGKRTGKWEFCMFHRHGNYPEGADPLFRNN